jgi:predicted ester cyclase
MSEPENVKIAQSSFDAINAHDKQRWSNLQADKSQQAYAPGTPGPLNREQSWAYIQGFLTAFPDLHFETMHPVAQGDSVVLHWTGTGTQTGPLSTPTGNTVPPTGKNATVQGSTTFEIKNGKITRSWIYWDMVTLLGQLGLMPPM